MKNTYTKPVLVMESFVMSQSIAHNCSKSLDLTQATTKYKSTCGWDTGFGTVAFINPDICNEITEEINGICYHNPDAGINIFNS